MPKRTHPRLRDYDYSLTGAYFVTICTHNKKCTLSRIVGRGLAPAETNKVEYTLLGEIAEQQLLLLKERYPCLVIDQYVIVPNRIHVIFFLTDEAAGASPRPTIMDVVCAYKSLTTKECRKHGVQGKIFQTSFHDHIIRDRKDLEKHVAYIGENPLKWTSNSLYV